MKQVPKFVVRYADIDVEQCLSTRSVFNFFQEAAIYHASQCGDTPNELRARGNAWVMMKVAVEFSDVAHYGEEVTVETWSRGAKGFKAFREFVVHCGGREICRATTVWVYYDAQLGRIVRIPEGLMETYTIEPELALSFDLDRWKASDIAVPCYSETLTTRTQDYDTNGHINNTAYLGFVDSVVSRRAGRTARFRSIRVQYEHEITPDVLSVDVLLDDSGLFSVSDGERVCVRGEYSVVGEWANGQMGK